MAISLTIRYYNPYIMCLYIWLYIQTAWLTHISVVERLQYDPLIVMPLMHGLIAFVFLLLLVFRIPLLDLWKGLNIREYLGFFLICVTVFFIPKFVFEDAGWIDCYLILQLPLILIMIDRAGVARLVLTQFLIMVSLAIEEYQKPEDLIYTFSGMMLIYSICFSLDYFAFRYEKMDLQKMLEGFKYQRWAKKAGIAHLIGMFYFVITVSLTGIVFYITPDFQKPPIFLEVKLIDESLVDEIQVRQISREEMEQVVYYTGGILIAILALLAFSVYLRKFRKKNEVVGKKKVNIASADFSFGDERIERLSSTKRKSGTPREMILNSYYEFCKVIAKRSRKRNSPETAREYSDILFDYIPGNEETIDQITAEFELAKYSKNEVSLEHALEYKAKVKSFLKDF